MSLDPKPEPVEASSMAPGPDRLWGPAAATLASCLVTAASAPPPGGHRDVLCGQGGHHVAGGGFDPTLVAGGERLRLHSVPNHDVRRGHEGLRRGQTRHQV